ncbi:thiol peroxidase [Myroides guanonis]|uniref:Thiol peroxidase n=1 Tax=Myroides guanonis TaxID=1150112 RepID=A0A1I3U883_9FLAO|nr:thiol peroxidase [Myroides guanonis]SFJ77997.1 thiol peroxidase (atypical 2-Cys peroxiredoxin) [Myroides guanonis]
MATITLKQNEIHTSGNLPVTNTKANDFTLVKTDLSTSSLSDYKGKRVILNIFPSIDTATCAMSVRQFNKQAAALDNTVVLCISRDLPFAQARFCGAEGIDNVVMLSDFNEGSFGKSYGLEIIDGPLKGLHSRCVIVLDENHSVLYTEQVPEIADEPQYEKALNILK